MSDGSGDPGEARRQRIEALFEAALNLPPAEREAFLRRECDGAADLLAELTRLVAAHDRLGPFLDQPTVDWHEGDATADGGPPLPSGRADEFELPPGTRVGPYTVLKGIGSGNMGTVYLASQDELRQHVALKVIRPGVLTAATRRRFGFEAEVLARLQHPGVARVYFAGLAQIGHGDQPYFAMEYVDGRTLDEYLKVANPGRTARLQLLMKVCQAVHHAHTRGVIHRDLKPSNILVTADGEPKVVDFGVARASGADAQLSASRTDPGRIVGTLRYMSPEQAVGDPAAVDTASDVYALGVVAYEMFAGRPPIDLTGRPLPAVVRSICETEPDRLGSVDRSLRGDVETVVGKAMAKEPGRRYADAGAMAEDVRRILADEPIAGRPPSAWYNATKFARRNRGLVAGVAATFAVLALGLVGTSVGFAREAVQRRRADAALAVAEQRRAEVERQTAADAFRTGSLAEARGDWATALTAYQAAEAAGYPDRLPLYVGQLRALDRLGRPDDGTALAARARADDPAAAVDPRFGLAEGILYWTADPPRSQTLIQSALASGKPLSDGDRYFAQALLTDDVVALAADLRRAVAADPFNRDAWAVLSLADMLLGNPTDAEQDAVLIRHLYPADHAGSILASFAATFQRRPDSARRHLDDDPSLPPAYRAACDDAEELLGKHLDIDDMYEVYQSPIAKAADVAKLLRVANEFVQLAGGPRGVPVPLAFSRLLPLGRSYAANVQTVFRLLSPGSAESRRLTGGYPGGIGAYMRGVTAVNDGRLADAAVELRAAATTPASLIECRRRSAALLVRVGNQIQLNQHATPDRFVDAVRPDLRLLIRLGGVRPFESERDIIAGACSHPALAGEGRTLALEWEARDPGDPRPLYYQAVAERSLGRDDLAAALLKVRLGMGDDRPSRDLLDEIGRTPMTRPADGVRRPVP